MKLLPLLLSTVAISSAAPAPQADPDAPLIYPYGTYRKWVQTGRTLWDPQDQLLIVKNGKAADETTTIVTFNFDESTRGKTCELIFDLWDRDVSTGSKKLDVFTYDNPPTHTSSFTASELAELKSRQIHVGRISVPKPGRATWDNIYQKPWPKIPCPAGELIGVEYVGVGDRVSVRWDIGVTGPRFRVLG